MDDRSTATPRDPASAQAPRGKLASLARELRAHPIGYGVMAAFVVIGPATALYLFPEAPPAVCIVGGFALGAYAAMCAVPQKFL
jgi:hypothetical protein